MEDIGLVALMLAAFVLTIGLVNLLDRLIRPDTAADRPDEQPDADGEPR